MPDWALCGPLFIVTVTDSLLAPYPLFLDLSEGRRAANVFSTVGPPLILGSVWVLLHPLPLGLDPSLVPFPCFAFLHT